MTLIPKEDLQTARARFQREQAAATPVAKAEPDEVDYSALRRKGAKRLCIDCGHPQSDHHTRPEGHYVNGDWLYYCVTAHCEAHDWRDGMSHECCCLHFRTRRDDVPELTRPAVGDWALCASCSHPRRQHCTKRKVTKALSHLDWKGLEIDGQPVPCKHTPEGGAPYACDSNACAQVLGEGDEARYCDCKKFVSPFLKKRAPAKAPATKPATPRISRVEIARRAAILIEVVIENPALTVAELTAAAECSPAWVRSTLKRHGITLGKPREKSAFTTGLISLAATDNAIQP